MVIHDIKFKPKPKEGKLSKKNTLFQMKRKIFFQMDPDLVGSTDELGSRPYKNYVDYLTGPYGNGVACDIQTPHGDDILQAAQQGEFLTHSILIRYDDRIDPRMIIRYPNYKTGKSRYWYIATITNLDFEWHYLRIGAVEIIEFDPDAAVT